MKLKNLLLFGLLSSLFILIIPNFGHAEVTPKVFDINKLPKLSTTAGQSNKLININGDEYFVASSGNNSLDLYKVDKTTTKVLIIKKDIGQCGEGCYTDYHSIGVIDNMFYFYDNKEIWKTNGTLEGTVSVIDLSSLSPSSFSDSFIINDYIYFNIDSKIKKFNTINNEYNEVMNPEDVGINDYSVSGNVANVNNSLYFVGYYYDGGVNSNNYRIIKIDTNNSDLLSVVYSFDENNSADSTIFSSQTNLYIYNHWGQISKFNTINNSISTINGNYTTGNSATATIFAGDSLYFNDQDNLVWVYKENSTNALLLNNDLRSVYSYYGNNNYNKNYLYISNILYFIDAGSNLWKTDGTGIGTLNITSSNFSISNVSSLFNLNGYLYFFAGDTSQNLFKYNNTSGTIEIITGDYYCDLSGYDSCKGFSVNNSVYLLASSNIDNIFYKGSIFKVNNSNNKAKLFYNLDKSTQDSGAMNLKISNNNLYFTADNGIDGVQLYKIDNNKNGYSVIGKNYAWDPDIGLNKNINNLTDVNGELYFTASAYYGEGGYSDGLFRVVGSDIVYINLNNGSNLTYVNNLANVNGILYFTGLDVSSSNSLYSLWKLNSNNEPVLVKGIQYGSSYLTNIDGILYFVANDSSANGAEIWRSDGTDSGTFMIKDINPGPNNSSPYYFTNLNGEVYFTAEDGVHGRNLWKSDGTENGTVLVSNMGVSSISGVIGDELYFTAYDGSANSLYKVNALSSEPVLVYNNISANSQFIKANGVSYFTDSLGNHLFYTDGTSEGVYAVWQESGSVNNLISIDNVLYYSGSYRGLNKLDGVDSQPELVSNIYTGDGSNEFASLDGVLYMTMYDPVYGKEIFRLPGNYFSRIFYDKNGNLVNKNKLKDRVSVVPTNRSNYWEDTKYKYLEKYHDLNGLELKKFEKNPPM